MGVGWLVVELVVGFGVGLVGFVVVGCFPVVVFGLLFGLGFV